MPRSRPIEPLPFEYFREERPAQGPDRFDLVLGPIELRLRGISRELGAALRRRFRLFEGGSPSPGGSGWQISVHDDDTRDYFIEPRRGENNPVLLACDGERIRFLGYQVAGWFDTGRGTGQLVFSRGTHEPADRAAENYVRACVAWQAVTAGGALVHAASAVRDGRAYLFYGESGAGKSTLSACNRRGQVVSDDLSLVLPRSAGGLQLVGSPFRGTFEVGEPVVGRWPLVAGFRIVQDRHAAVRPVSRPRAMAELVGNLPFVAEAFAARPELLAGVDAAFRDVPLSHLHFRKDDSYWDAIAGAGL